MRTLVLDLATVFGHCFGDDRGVQHHGSFTLPSTGEDIGKFLSAYRGWMNKGIALYQPEEIVFESPVLASNTSLAACRKSYGLAGLTELIAADAGIPCREANLSQIRNHFIGTSRAPKTVTCEPGCKRKQCGKCRARRRKWVKDQTIAKCQSLGFMPADDNEADALALYSFVQAMRKPGYLKVAA